MTKITTLSIKEQRETVGRWLADNWLTDEQIEFIYLLVGLNPTNWELITYCLDKNNIDYRGKIDTAIPLDWSRKIEDYGINPSDYYWSYIDQRISGAPLNKYMAIVNYIKQVFNK